MHVLISLYNSLCLTCPFFIYYTYTHVIQTHTQHVLAYFRLGTAQPGYATKGAFRRARYGII